MPYSDHPVTLATISLHGRRPTGDHWRKWAADKYVKVAAELEEHTDSISIVLQLPSPIPATVLLTQVRERVTVAVLVDLPLAILENAFLRITPKGQDLRYSTITHNWGNHPNNIGLSGDTSTFHVLSDFFQKPSVESVYVSGTLDVKWMGLDPIKPLEIRLYPAEHRPTKHDFPQEIHLPGLGQPEAHNPILRVYHQGVVGHQGLPGPLPHNPLAPHSSGH